MSKETQSVEQKLRNKERSKSNNFVVVSLVIHKISILTRTKGRTKLWVAPHVLDVNQRFWGKPFTTLLHFVLGHLLTDHASSSLTSYSADPTLRDPIFFFFHQTLLSYPLVKPAKLNSPFCWLRWLLYLLWPWPLMSLSIVLVCVCVYLCNCTQGRLHSIRGPWVK